MSGTQILTGIFVGRWRLETSVNYTITTTLVIRPIEANMIIQHMFLGGPPRNAHIHRFPLAPVAAPFLQISALSGHTSENTAESRGMYRQACTVHLWKDLMLWYISWQLARRHEKGWTASMCSTVPPPSKADSRSPSSARGIDAVAFPPTTGIDLARIGKLSLQMRCQHSHYSLHGTRDSGFPGP